METVIAIIGLIGIVGLIVYFKYSNNKEYIEQQETLNELKVEYEISLKGTDKREALQKGRAYYSFLRGGELSIYDETAINNDLMVM